MEKALPLLPTLGAKHQGEFISTNGVRYPAEGECSLRRESFETNIDEEGKGKKEIKES